MKKTIYFLLIFLFAGCIAVQSATPVDSLLDRIGGAGTASRFVTAIVPATDGQDYFTLSAENGKPKITGNSYLSVATGIGWYLKYYAGTGLSWNCLVTDLTTAALPLPENEETRRTHLKYRYYLNYCTYSYSMAFWDWERWQKEIDWMALHGINLPLALTGTEVVWRNILVNNLGYTNTEANAFVAGSGYQAWFLMNNLEGWGGPNPDSWYDRQENLQKKILARMLQLDMKPVLAGYSGMVPHDIGAKKGWDITLSNRWCNFIRPEFIKPDDPHFDEIAQLYYDEMKRLYGSSDYYSIDLFHEGSVPNGINIGNTYSKVYELMRAHSGASNPKWVLQSWGNNPRQEALNALSPGKLIVLDLFSDGEKRWSNSYRQSGGAAHEFVFCMLHNFGGRTGLHGRLAKTINDFYDAQTQFPSTMSGVGATMEGIETNPVLYEALYELPWRATKTDADGWIQNYPQFRYGKANPTASLAWRLLNRSVYNCTTSQQGTSESVLCARPALTVNSVSTWSTATIYWNTQDVRNAATLLLMQSDELDGVNYRYDVVDVVRQTLADYANELLKRIQSAHSQGEENLRNTRIDTFLNIILDQDRLLNTVPDFMVGKWLDDARKAGNSDAEKNLYEKNARMLITTWGDRINANGGGLHDYSNREWGGLLAGYYYPRWLAFFNKIKSGQPAPNADAFFDMEWTWATANSATLSYPTESQENPVIVAREVYAKYFSLPASITVDRSVSVHSEEQTQGCAYILNEPGDTVYSVTNREVVEMYAIPSKGYVFTGWTDAGGDTISRLSPYLYLGNDPAVFTAHFTPIPDVYSYLMDNDLDVIHLNPPLSTDDRWQLTAETRIFQHGANPNGAYNNWGSALFVDGTNPVADTYNSEGRSFQYYLAQGGGALTLKNNLQHTLRPNVTVNSSEGVNFRFEIISSGNGSLQLTAYINNVEIDRRTSAVSVATISDISKASTYPMTVEVMGMNQTGGGRPPLARNDKAVSLRYYNLQGIEVDKPSEKGVYVVKEGYISGKVLTYKKIVQE